MTANRRTAWTWWEPALLLAVAVGLRLVHLDSAPHFDELYHLLAGLSWIREGDLCIADCLSPYSRGALFTYLVGGSLALFGNEVVVARIPSLVAGSFLVVVVFLWIRRRAGRMAAWIAGLLFAVGPLAIHMSQFSRFYALHALLFWIGALAVYALVESTNGRAPGGAPAASWWLRAGLIAVAALSLLAAYELQIMTLIGLAALAVWIAVDPFPAAARRHRGRRWMSWAAGTLLVLLLAAGLYAVESGLLERLWGQYRWSNLRAAGDQREILFYHHWLYGEYGPLYALFPAAAVVALARHFRLALFCSVLFVVGFVAHSFGGFKGWRLIYWIMPTFYAIWGIALAAVARPLWNRALRVSGRLFRGTLPARWQAAVGALGLALAVLFVAGNTGSFNTTWKLMTLSDDEWPASKPWYRGHSNWVPVEPTLQEIADEVEVVLATSGPKAIYYLGRLDASISRGLLYGINPGSGTLAPQFSRGRQTGRPILSEPEALRRVVACYGSGLIVVERGHWRRSVSLPEATANFIERATRRIPLPEKHRLLAFRWQHGAGGGTPAAECSPPPLSY